MQLLLTTSVDQEIRRSLISFFFLQPLEKGGQHKSAEWWKFYEHVNLNMLDYLFFI